MNRICGRSFGRCGIPSASSEVFNRGVVLFDLRCGGTGDDEHFDLVPPPADRAVEPARLGLARKDHPFQLRLRRGVLPQVSRCAAELAVAP